MGTSRTARAGAKSLRPAAMLRAVHELFVAGEVDASYLDSSLRPIVAEELAAQPRQGRRPRRVRATLAGG